MTALATVAPAPAFDWKHPDYAAVFNERMRRLAWIREDKTGARLANLKAYYRDHPADFIDDWGVTFDPRNADIGLPTTIPFKLFPKQREWIDFVLRKWGAREKAITEKSRDCGISWVAVGLACTLCLFRRGVTIGFGSNLERNVDTLDDPKSLFFKARMFLQMLPPEFLDGWTTKDAPHMRIKFQATRSNIFGEAGTQIGRGGRATIFFVDEAAHLEQAMLVEASLSQTTNCRIDISSVNGRSNPFAEKRFGGKIEVFIFDWRDDPRKDDAWYEKQVNELDPVTLAQEVDRNYNASVEGVLIPSAWVQAAIDSHVKLGIAVTGAKRGALDVADEGRDTNAFAGAHGPLLQHLEEWSGKGDDIFGTVVRTFNLCDALGYPGFKYDADGLGAGVRGDARVHNDTRRTAGQTMLEVDPFRGSEGVFQPEAPIPEDAANNVPAKQARKNKDFFKNRKAQAWWNLRRRFQSTYRAVTASAPYSADDIISIPGDLPLLTKLTGELAQPTYDLDNQGRIIVNKVPDGTKSPNLADAVMIVYSQTTRAPMRIDPGALRRV